MVVDDYGLHAGVCQAALALVAKQRVQGIGCMVGAPAWSAWAGALKALDPGAVDVGLHLDLTEYPLKRSARRLGRLLICSFSRQMDRASVLGEVRAQLDAFERDIGRAPAFVDGHQHVHQLPIVREVLLSELQQRYASALPWLRATRCPPGAGVKPRLIAALGAQGLLAPARAQGFRSNERLLGVYDFSGGEARYRALLSGWLRDGHTGDVLMCHPAQSAEADDVIGAAREAEYRVLGSDAMGDLLREHQVALAPMSQLLSNRR